MDVDLNRCPRVCVVLHRAIAFVNSVHDRLSSRRFQEFINIMDQHCVGGQTVFNEFHKRIARLFVSHDDLLDQFESLSYIDKTNIGIKPSDASKRIKQIFLAQPDKKVEFDKLLEASFFGELPPESFLDRIKSSFNDQNGVILDFSVFLAKTDRIRVQDDNFHQAVAFVNSICICSVSAYENFVALMHQNRVGEKSSLQVLDEIHLLFEGYPELIDKFHMFIW